METEGPRVIGHPTHAHTYTYTHTHKYVMDMLIAALLIIAELWNQCRCPTTEEWIRPMWFKYIWSSFQS